MFRDRRRDRNAAPDREEPEAPPRASAPQAAMLALQRSAGNAAVTRLLQRAPVKTGEGEFRDVAYVDYDKDGKVGVEMTLEFDPGPRVNAKKIGLTQAVRTLDDGKPDIIEASQRERTVKSGVALGYKTDRLSGQNNPIYGAPVLRPGQGLDATPESDAPGKPVGGGADDAKYRLGWHYRSNGQVEKQSAQLRDAPKVPRPAPGHTASQVFETTAVAIEGKDKDLYYGSVEWGWEIDERGQFKRLPLTLLRESMPSSRFVDAAKLWNAFEYPPGLPIPGADNKSTTIGEVGLTIGTTEIFVPAGVDLTFPPNPDLARDSLLLTLPTEITIARLGRNSDFQGWIPSADIGPDNKLLNDVPLTGTGGKKKPFTLAKGATVTPGAVVGSTTLCSLASGTVKGLDFDLRLAWLPTLAMGRKTADLPMPQ
jgi:hypothetical protein